ncbi:type VII secretion protein EssA [Bacillus alkalicola]|uniref:Type VII secretion protein EssA n=1 Tax=Evansella alkalicola TaxID=745819 RepID=A0ABS6JZG3_9BACI|nr:type VII secretion protein EssA [Bacillus alkalicola]
MLVFGEDSPEERGKMNLEVDRINTNSNSNNQRITLTELERNLPDLFTVGTLEKINYKQLEEDKWLEELQGALFQAEVNTDQQLEEVQAALFTEEYTVTTTSTTAPQEEEGGSQTILFGFLTLVSIVGGAVYLMLEKVLD